MSEDFESAFGKLIDVNMLISKLNDGLNNLIQQGDIDEESKAKLQVGSYYTQFAGVSLYILNYSKRKPYFIARLNIIDKKNNRILAWYDQEYNFDFEILDDYFDFL